MRKSFDGLSALVQHEMKADPANGSVYIFLNKQRNLIKLLHWEQGGFTLYYKRLEKGQVERPRAGESGEINWSDLMLAIEGISLEGVARKKRFFLKKTG